MGLKTTNYTIEEYGITVPQAYARISDVHIAIDGKCTATFEVQQTRNDIGEKRALDRVYFDCEIDKEQPIYKQVYENAKAEIFTDWEDDIV